MLFRSTADVASELPAPVVLASLLSFVAIYAAVMAAYLYYVLKVIRKGPTAGPIHPAAGETGPARPAFGGVEDS